MGTFEELGLSYATVSSLLGLFIAAAVVSAVIYVALNTLKAAAICDISFFLGFKNPWYSFVPVLSGFAYGRLASDGRRESDREGASLGILIAILDFLYIALIVVVCAVFLIGGVQLIFDADVALAEGRELDKSSFNMLSKMLFPMFLLGIFTAIRKIAYTVCTYKVFSVVSRKKAVVYTVLSFIIPILLPFFLFSSRGNRIYTDDDYDDFISGFNLEE